MREGERQRSAFERYLRLGGWRSIEKLHEALAADGDAPCIRTLYEWSSKLNWQARIDEIQDAASEASRRAYVEQLRELNEFQAKIGRALQNRGAIAIASIDLKEFSPTVALRAVEAGARLERTARDGNKPLLIDITEQIRAMAVREGFDPDQTVKDAIEIEEQVPPATTPRPLEP